MRNQYQILAEKYTQVQEIKGENEPTAKDLDELATVFYIVLRDTNMGAVPAAFEELTNRIYQMATNGDQAASYLEYIMMRVSKIAQAQNRTDVLRKFSDMTRIMRSGMGLNKPGLNEQG